MIFFGRSAHYIALVARWGGRFRLPTCYVHPKKTPALASGCVRRSLAVCDLAIGGITTQKPIHQEFGRRKRLPHSGTSIRYDGPRDRQSRVRPGLAARSESREGRGRRHSPRRDRPAILSTSRVGNHAQSCARFASAEGSATNNHALVERIHRASGQSNTRPYRRTVLAR